jgi:hypothetical protein
MHLRPLIDERMTVAERLHVKRRIVGIARLAEILHIVIRTVTFGCDLKQRLVRIRRMIAVAGIVVDHLPVRAYHHPLRRTAHDNFGLGVAIEPLIEQRTRAREIFDERLRIRIERAEDESAIALHAR